MISGEVDRLGGGFLGLDLEADKGRSEVSSSFGVGRRSKELEEAEVRAELEEDDLFVVVYQGGIELVMVALGCCSDFVEVASLFDVRRAVEVVG